MNNVEKRLSTRERVKRHRAVKSDVQETLRKRSRYYLRQHDGETSRQIERRVRDADNDPEQEASMEFVSPRINSSPVTSDSDCDIATDNIINGFEERHAEANCHQHQAVNNNNNNNNRQAANEIIQIRDWAIENDIQQNELDQLLAILRPRLIPTLPKSSKTFLNTAGANYKIREMESADGSKGEFVYFGVAKNISACAENTLHEDKTFLLQFNIDGIPLFNNSSKQFWPILCKVFFSPDIYKPFVVAIYSGNNKPKDVNDFLTEFVCEINKLLAEGIMIEENHFKVKIQCFICDTPTRAFLKCIERHGGYSACERCETHGERIHNRTVYPQIDCQGRTDGSFRRQTQPEHHTGHSLLIEIEPPLDLVSQFVLDSMHLLCNGIMKKLCKYWMFGESQNLIRRSNKLGPQQRRELSSRMDNLRRCIPMEFQWKPTCVSRVAMWKATDLRFFLLYCGPIVLRGILNPDLYKHFLLLHTACRILCSEDLAFRYNDHAKIYLRTFFATMPVFYGRQSQILNAHHLIHIADDVKNMGCTLSKISAFPFEILLGKIKMHLRDDNRPLAQMCRRLHELSFTEKKASIPEAIEILKFTKEREAERIKVQRIKYKGFILTTKFPNNLVLLNDDIILTVTKMMCIEGIPESTEIEGNEWKIKSSIFKYPTPSKTLKMWRLDNEPTMRKIKRNVHAINCKMVQLKIDGGTCEENEKCYAMPFLRF